MLLNEQELNRKLAEWVGSHSIRFRDGETYGYDSQERLHWLQFTQSIDACFEWLVPKLGVQVRLGIYMNCRMWNVSILQGYDGAKVLSFGENNNLALALCLAIEKLIDREQNAIH